MIRWLARTLLYSADRIIASRLPVRPLMRNGFETDARIPSARFGTRLSDLYNDKKSATLKFRLRSNFDYAQFVFRRLQKYSFVALHSNALVENSMSGPDLTNFDSM